MPRKLSFRQRQKVEDPERYAHFLQKQKQFNQRRRDELKKQWEEDPHSKAVIEERERRRRLAKIRRHRFENRRAAHVTKRSPKGLEAPEPRQKKPAEMTPDELKAHRAKLRLARLEKMSHQKKTALREKNKRFMQRFRDRQKQLKMQEVTWNKSGVTCKAPPPPAELLIKTDQTTSSEPPSLQMENPLPKPHNDESASTSISPSQVLDDTAVAQAKKPARKRFSHWGKKGTKKALEKKTNTGKTATTVMAANQIKVETVMQAVPLDDNSTQIQHFLHPSDAAPPTQAPCSSASPQSAEPASSSIPPIQFLNDTAGRQGKKHSSHLVKKGTKLALKKKIIAAKAATTVMPADQIKVEEGVQQDSPNPVLAGTAVGKYVVVPREILNFPLPCSSAPSQSAESASTSIISPNQILHGTAAVTQVRKSGRKRVPSKLKTGTTVKKLLEGVIQGRLALDINTTPTQIQHPAPVPSDAASSGSPEAPCSTATPKSESASTLLSDRVLGGILVGPFPLVPKEKTNLKPPCSSSPPKSVSSLLPRMIQARLPQDTATTTPTQKHQVSLLSNRTPPTQTPCSTAARQSVLSLLARVIQARPPQNTTATTPTQKHQVSLLSNRTPPTQTPCSTAALQKPESAPSFVSPNQVSDGPAAGLPDVFVHVDTLQSLYAGAICRECRRGSISLHQDSSRAEEGLSSSVGLVSKCEECGAVCGRSKSCRKTILLAPP